MEDNRLYLQSEVEESEGSNDNRVGLTLEEQNTRIPSFQAVDSSKCSNMVSDIEMDYSTEFTTDEIFKSKDDMVQWTREVGMRNGIVVVIKSSDAGTLTRRPRVTFGCERGGTYRAPKQKGDVEIPIEKRRNTGTKKCGCPFTLKGQKLATDDDWSLKVVCGVHNHPTVTYHEGHPFSGRLSSEETSLLADMSISLVRPKDILVTLKSRDPDNSSTIKAIYNVRQRLKVAEKAGRLHMQALLGKLAEKNYLEFHQSCGDTDYVQDLFWAHPIDIDLLRTFPRVLIMDCTHKTSRYKLPLFEIVGITSTDKTFVVAFAFLCDEKEDNYRWALDRLRTLMDPNDLPQVIVTDRELALMNAVAKVFPRARHMICSWHVEKNIASKCKNFFGTKREWDKFNSMWNLIVYASTEEEYNSHVSNINVQFNSYPDAIKYVTDNWLNPYKEKFVAAWTDRHMHFGNTTMNRVESAHARLKKQLGSSQGNFETTWTAIDGLLELLHTNIKASFEESKTVVQHNYQPALFRDLRGCISMTALDLVLAQSKRADSVGVDARVCGCVIRRTHGLPCAHEIADYKREGRPIPLESIDVHWTRLSMVPMKKMGISCQVELDLINDRFNALDESAQKHLLQKLRELASPETTTLVEPHVKTKSRGRPLGKKAKVDTSTKCEPSSFEYEDLVPSHEDSVPTPINFDSTLVSTSNTKPMLQRKSTVLEKVHRSRNLKPKTYLHSFPAGLLPYISHIEDVPGDGNCGYRAIAGLMGFGQNEWARVRRDLSKELHAHIDDYRRIIWATDDIGEVERRLDWFDEHNPAPYEKWLLLPEMGFLISSCYNVVLYLLSASICCTFLPLRTVPESIESRVEIAIGFVNGNHFIQASGTKEQSKDCSSRAIGDLATKERSRIQENKSNLSQNVYVTNNERDAINLKHSRHIYDFPHSEEQNKDNSSKATGELAIQERSSGEIAIQHSSANNPYQGRYFYYDFPHSEETGPWIPVSVPPRLESDHAEWNHGLGCNGGYFPEGDMGWGQFIQGDKELTMWDVVSEMLLAVRGKVSALASGELKQCNIAWLSSHLLEQAWKEMAQTLTDVNFNTVREILEADPPKWLADSTASACMLCSVRFHPIMCSRHHCRFCGGVFCGECSKGRSLMPEKFRVVDPQRVCDVCYVRLEAVQSYLQDKVSRAAQLPTHDLTDLSTLRSWVNFPWGQSMEYEIYKATNTVRGYTKVGSTRRERSIPDTILRQAKGLAILTVMKVGLMVTYNIGTGLVIARREDGSWSAPSAISSFGVGWGAQGGGELTDFIIVLRTEEAVRTFSGNLHFSIGAGLSAAAGIVGRAFEADVHAGDGGFAACYTYSCSKGAFVGCSLEGSIVSTRASENSRFYGISSFKASDILLGSLPKPPAAAILYSALSDLFQKLEKQ